MWIFWLFLSLISLVLAIFSLENTMLWYLGGVAWLAVAYIDFSKRD